jgi:hypothetical protein
LVRRIWQILESRFVRIAERETFTGSRLFWWKLTVVHVDDDFLCLQLSAAARAKSEGDERQHLQLAVKFTPLFDLHRVLFLDKNKTNQSLVSVHGNFFQGFIRNQGFGWSEVDLICERACDWLVKWVRGKYARFPANIIASV